ncbi:MAG: efflux RND transporter permease subunit [Bacillales bacterium]|nr:efflux RND transporter permease subunit [Bacillales bacterium]
MEKWIQSFSQRLLFIFVMILLLFAWGFYSALEMKKEYMPQIHNPVLMITLKTRDDANGQKQAVELSDQITSAIKSVEHLQSIESTVYPKGLFLSLTFPENADMKKAEEDVKSSLQLIAFPDGVDRPEITRISSDSFPFMEISLTSHSSDVLQPEQTKNIQKELEQLPGIEKIQATGDGQEGYIVTLHNQSLHSHDLDFEHVKAALQNRHLSWPDGKVQTKNMNLLLNVEGDSISKKTLENVVVGEEKGHPILLKDVASIQKGTVHVQTISRTNGRPSVLLNLYKTPSADITKVSQEVLEKIHDLQKDQKKTIQTTVLFNHGEDVSQSMKGLWREGLLGCLFSILCVFIFFRQGPSTIAVLFTLPICFLATIGVLHMMGFTLNLLTISGLIVAMGRVVDDSIVILDNMYRKLERHGAFSFSVLAEGVKEMIPAVVASTLTTIAVYMPLALTGTMVGHAFAGFAWAVTIALLCSLAVSICLIPPYTATTWKRRFIMRAPHMEQRSKSILEAFLKKRKVWFTSFCVALILSVAGAFFIPVNVLPRSHAKDINIQIECPEGYTLSQVNSVVRELESLLRQHKEIQSFASTSGSSFTPVFDDVFDQGGGWIQQPNIANVYVTPRKGVKVDALIAKLNGDLKQLSPEAVYNISSQQMAGDDSRVNIVLSGAERDELVKTAALLKSKLQMIKGLQIYGEGDQSGQARFTVRLNEEKVRQLGLDQNEIFKRIDSFMDQQEEVSIDGNGFTVPVELHKPSDLSISYAQGTDPTQEFLLKLGRLTFASKNGTSVSLQEIAKLEIKNQSIISERNGSPIAVISGNILTPDIGGVTKQIEQTLKNSHVPKEIHVEYGGIPQQVKQMIASIVLAGFLSVLLVLLIITSIFKGIRAPLAVLSSLPFALIGSIVCLFVFRQSWNIGALVGLVMLIGIVATNGIVLVDRMEKLRRKGVDLHTVIVEGTASRVRPVLMTASATILTLLPLSLSRQSDLLISRSLGLVVVGGLITATLTSLIVIPTIYYWLFMKRANAKQKIAAKSEQMLYEG